MYFSLRVCFERPQNGLLNYSSIGDSLLFFHFTRWLAGLPSSQNEHLICSFIDVDVLVLVIAILIICRWFFLQSAYERKEIESTEWQRRWRTNKWHAAAASIRGKSHSMRLSFDAVCVHRLQYFNFHRLKFRHCNQSFKRLTFPRNSLLDNCMLGSVLCDAGTQRNWLRLCVARMWHATHIETNESLKLQCEKQKQLLWNPTKEGKMGFIKTERSHKKVMNRVLFRKMWRGSAESAGGVRRTERETQEHHKWRTTNALPMPGHNGAHTLRSIADVT